MQPADQLGQYTTLSAIDKGGMGDVRKATDTKLGRAVVIKPNTYRAALATDRYPPPRRA